LEPGGGLDAIQPRRIEEGTKETKRAHGVKFSLFRALPARREIRSVLGRKSYMELMLWAKLTPLRTSQAWLTGRTHEENEKRKEERKVAQLKSPFAEPFKNGPLEKFRRVGKIDYPHLNFLNKKKNKFVQP